MAWRDVASVADGLRAQPWLALDSRKLGGRDVVLAAVDGTWYGVENRCTHALCAFTEDASLEGAVIVCNCHGSEFDIRSGAVVRGPADRSIRTFRVRVSGDRLQVDV